MRTDVAPGLDATTNPAKVSAMHPERLKLVETLSVIQVAAGLVILAVLLVAFYRSGRLRRAFAFPPAMANSLTGAHLLLVLAAFLAASSLVSLTFRTLGIASPEPAAESRATAAQAVPPDTRHPTPGDAAAAAASQLAPSPRAEMHKLAAQVATETITLGVMLYLAHVTFAGGLAGFGLRINRLGRDLFWAITGYLAFWPVCAGVAAVATWLLHALRPTWTPPEHEVLVFLQEPGVSWLWTVLPWALAGLIAPFFEEVLFRGLLLSWLRKASRSIWLAIVLTALAFGLNHSPQWHLVPALTALGLMQGYLYARTRSLSLAILFHVVFNLRTLTLVAIAGQSLP
jgi:membrane protease YdiL (CAAX protease family)